MIILGLIFGRILFWVFYPLLWLYLRNTTRTRALIVHDNQVLVIRSWLSAGDWHLPGGGLHKSEDPKQGLVREVFEETSIRLDENKLTLLYKHPVSNRGIKIIAECYKVELNNRPNLKLQKLEIAQAKWTSLINPNLKLSPDTLQATQKWLKSS